MKKLLAHLNLNVNPLMLHLEVVIVMNVGKMGFLVASIGVWH